MNGYTDGRSHGQPEINPTHTAIRHVAQLQCQYRIPSYLVAERNNNEKRL